ncbi:hypothetical protein FHL15_004717 [Xylaria flabelliformis]|uniref:Reticulon domain-containing protein n=1 Tax=Xylaria flabelliformis TaxID=2512241 RepID=A0A553I217_9PEZI|nr:hypothetical protein FHL15_004717 [Xylaria flabelliformis]
MSVATYVVKPVLANGSSQQQDPYEVAAAIQESMDQKLHSNDHQDPEPEPVEEGPLKKVIAHSDSLYKYISWEDPIRTLGSYFGLLGLLYAVHYLRCTQLLLKICATALGVVSFTSLVSRSTKTDFIAHLRPEYKEFPETTLNATLNDIHDLVQYLVVEAQKIIYGEDLGKTFGAFISFTSLFWLMKILSPFNLEVLGLSSAYIIPLLFSSNCREVAQNAKSRAQGLVHKTAVSAESAASDGKAKAADLTHKTQQVAGDLMSNTQHTASDMSSNAQQAVGNAAAKTQETATNLSSSAQQATRNATSKTHQTASNLSPETSRFAGVLSSRTAQSPPNIPSKIQMNAETQQAPMDTQPHLGNLVDGKRLPGAQQHIYQHPVKQGYE